jgi:hypothetical protein
MSPCKITIKIYSIFALAYSNSSPTARVAFVKIAAIGKTTVGEN